MNGTRCNLRNWLLLVSAGVCIAAGCGGAPDGPERFDVSGQVTFKGQPIPGGFIILSPDSAKGNNGPQGKARIRNGHYSTNASGGKGIVGGPHLVKIFGTDGVPYVDDSGSEQADGKPLFPPWQTEADFKDPQSTQDFQVPVSALMRAQ